MSHDRFIYVGPPRPLPWAEHAACRDEPTDIWYPTRRGPVAVDWTRPRSICQSCPVLTDCRSYAVAHEPDWGMWGGLTPEERRAFRRRRRRYERTTTRIFAELREAYQ